MKKLHLIVLSALLFSICSTQMYAQPTFQSGEDPKPSGKKWEKIENLSDEFDDGFNTSKWAKNVSTWDGRVPGLFKESAVTVSDGNLLITADELPVEEQVDGWTHQGGLVRSINQAEPSYQGYYECRIKANKTFMSSTFWLINTRNEESGCDERTTELDIQETVGYNSNGESWVDNRMQQINSNTHSRNTSCDSTPIGDNGNQASIGGLAYEDYYIYGAWWKSATEVLFYVDGVYKYTITPPADFNLNMYLRMVVETYDWNPVPSDGGMNGSFSERTTYYDWVRSWKLVDDEGGNEDDDVVDETFFIVNRETGKKIRQTSLEDGQPLELVPYSWSGNPTQWTKVDTDNGYFYLKNVETDSYFRPTNDSDGSVLIQRPTSYDGSYTQWKQVDTSDDYFYLENRATGMYFRPDTDVDYSPIVQRPTSYTGNWTQWKFIGESSGEALKLAQTTIEGFTEQGIRNAVIYPNPVSRGSVTIETGIKEGHRTINIFNSVGQLVYNYAGGEQKIQIAADDFDSGLYIVKLKTGNNTSVHKLIIE